MPTGLFDNNAYLAVERKLGKRTSVRVDAGYFYCFVGRGKNLLPFCRKRPLVTEQNAQADAGARRGNEPRE